MIKNLLPLVRCFCSFRVIIHILHHKNFFLYVSLNNGMFFISVIFVLTLKGLCPNSIVMSEYDHCSFPKRKALNLYAYISKVLHK